MAATRITFDSPDLTQRIVEFLPFDEVCGPSALLVRRYASRRYYGKRCLKAVSRCFRTAARRALTRGHWRPIRRLEQDGITHLVAQQDTGFSHHMWDNPPFLRDAWAADPGATMVVLLTDRTYSDRGPWGHHLGLGNVCLASNFLLLVEPNDDAFHRDSDGFKRILSAFEYAFGAVRSGGLLYQFLWGWFDWWSEDEDGFDTPNGYCQLFCKIAKDPLGPALEAWSNPRLAAQFVLDSVEFMEGGEPWWEPWGYDALHLTRYGLLMSSEWEDRDKARRFVDFLRTHQIPRDEALLADPDASEGARGPGGILGPHLGDP